MTRKEFQFLSTDITEWQYLDHGRCRHPDGGFEVRRLDFLADVRQFPHQELCGSFTEVYVIEGLREEPARVTLVTADSGKDIRPIPDDQRRVPSIDLHVARIIAPDPVRLRLCLQKQASYVSAAYALL
jgi:hypothetical protein